MSAFRFAVVILCLLLAPAGLAHAETPAGHIRVVLDLSGSMSTQDPSRLALMSTALLRDLLRPDPNHGDTFSVYPFEPAADWNWQPGGEPPRCTSTPIRGDDPTRRDAFIAELQRKEYRGIHTWYTPCVEAALQSFPAAGGTPQPRRVLVLLTDGLPADDVPEPGRSTILTQEKQRIRTAVEQARRSGPLDVYILAFGAKAAAAEPWLRELSSQDAGGAPLATLRIVTDVGRRADEGGGGLPMAMVDIYKESFGYASSFASAEAGQFSSDLPAGDRVAVVSFGRESRLPAPVVGESGYNHIFSESWNPPDRSWRSFGLSWLSSSRSGRAHIAAGQSEEVLILRPRRWIIQPVGPLVQEVVAGQVTEVAFELKAVAGAGDLGNAMLHAFYETPESPGGSDAGRAGPPYRFNAIWPARGTNEVYEGRLRVVASPGDQPRTVLEEAVYPVRVYPPVALRLLSSDGGMSLRLGDSGRGLTEGPSPDVTIQLQGAETLPNSMQAIPIQFVLGEPRPVAAGVQGNGTPADVVAASTFRVRSAATAGRAAVAYATGDGPGLAGSTAEAHDWQSGVPMTRAQIADGFRLSVDAASGRHGGTVQLDLRAIINQPPYSNYPDLVPPLKIDLTIEEPSLARRLGPVGLITLLALWVLALLLYGRARARMPPDFRTAVWREGAAPAAPRPLYPSSAVRALFGLSERHPLSIDEAGQPFGTIEPVEDDLYRLRLAANVSLGSDGVEPVADGHAWLVRAGATYLLTTPGGRHKLWLGFSPAVRPARVAS